MKKEKFIKEFEAWVEKNRLKKLECDYDHGYRDGQRDMLEDLKVWLKDEPGETINKLDAEFYKYFYVIGDEGYLSVHVVFLFNGEFCRLQAEVEPYWVRNKNPATIALSILDDGDEHGSDKQWKRQDKNVLKWEISDMEEHFYALLKIGNVALELWLKDRDLWWRSNFDSRTDTLIKVEDNQFHDNHYHIVKGDLFHTLAWKGTSCGESHTSHSTLEEIRDYIKGQGYDTRLRPDPLGLQLEEIWIKG